MVDHLRRLLDARHLLEVRQALDAALPPGDDCLDGSGVAVIVAHPDDETIGCGALLGRLAGARVLVVTDGAPLDPEHLRRSGFACRDRYARARALELRAAMELAGLGEGQVRRLRLPDGSVWRHLSRLTQDLTSYFVENRIRLVLTHAYEGGHSDHDGVAKCVRAAARLRGGAAPLVVEMPLYHRGPEGFAAQTFCDGDEGLAHALTQSQRQRKQAMFDRYASQARALASFHLATERFRLAPDYDFSRPPNAGRLRYSARHLGEARPWPALLSDAVAA